MAYNLLRQMASASASARKTDILLFRFFEHSAHIGCTRDHFRHTDRLRNQIAHKRGIQCGRIPEQCHFRQQRKHYGLPVASGNTILRQLGDERRLVPIPQSFHKLIAIQQRIHPAMLRVRTTSREHQPERLPQRHVVGRKQHRLHHTDHRRRIRHFRTAYL